MRDFQAIAKERLAVKARRQQRKAAGRKARKARKRKAQGLKARNQGPKAQPVQVNVPQWVKSLPSGTVVIIAP